MKTHHSTLFAPSVLWLAVATVCGIVPTVALADTTEMTQPTAV